MNCLLGAKMLGKCLTVIEVAEMMNVSRGTVIRWIKTGRLRAFKLGGGRLWRIRERDLKRLIRGGSDAPMHSADGTVPAESKSS